MQEDDQEVAEHVLVISVALRCGGMLMYRGENEIIPDS